MVYVTRATAKRHFRGSSRSSAHLSVFLDYLDMMTVIDTAMSFAMVVMPEDFRAADLKVMGCPEEAAVETLSKVTVPGSS